MLAKLWKIKSLLLILVAVTLIAAMACAGEEEEEPTVAPAAPAPTAAPAAPAPTAAPVAPAPTVAPAAPAPTAAPAAPAPTVAPAPAPAALLKWVPEPEVPGEYFVHSYDGPRPTRFQEAPILAELVRQGRLPPVEERLPVPEDIKYVGGPSGAGAYGGTIRNNGAMWASTTFDQPRWSQREPDSATYTSGVGFHDISEDGRTFTMRLRRGLKWSDGSPFTIEDVRFAWEDSNFNQESNPHVPAHYRDAVTGNRVMFEVIDDHTWTLSFDSPNFTLTEQPGITGAWCAKGSYCWYSDSARFKQFHPDYADAGELKKKMDAATAPDWTALWAQNLRGSEIAGKPCLGAWCLESQSDAQQVLTRNPYYFYVDPEGNQLPYADHVRFLATESRDVAVFRGMAGENDAISIIYQLPELPLYRTNMERGDFRINHWPSGGGNDAPLFLSQTYNEDPELGKWLRTKDFRRALSFAIDRSAINEAIFLGMGVIQNQCVVPVSPWYPGLDICQFETNYDPSKANQLLDSIGLDKKDSDGFRLRTDGSGKRLSFLDVISDDESVEVSEFIKSHLADVGIDMSMKVSGTSYKVFRASEAPLNVSIDASAHQENPWSVSWTRLVPLTAGSHLAPAIGTYYETGGVSGMAPTGPDPMWADGLGRVAPAGTFPADISGNLKRLADLWEQGKETAKYSPQRQEIARQIYQINAEEKYMIPTVGFTGTRRGVHISRNNVMNVNKTYTREKFGYHHELYYFEGGVDNCQCPAGQPIFSR